MSKFRHDPGDPEVVDAIIDYQKSLTREQWEERIARLTGAVTAGEVPVPSAASASKAKPSRKAAVVKGSLIAEAASSNS